MISARIPADTVAKLDGWAARNEVTRSTAVRRLVEIGLDADKPHQSSAKTRTRAAELAGAAIDKASDPTATADERAVRKRRVLQGPSMARAIRKD